MLECLIAIQRQDPRVALALYLDFYKNKMNAEIAQELGTTVRTVTRYKQRGLVLLRAEMEKRGVRDLKDV